MAAHEGSGDKAKQPGAGNDDFLDFVVVELAKGALWALRALGVLAWWAVLFPMLSLPAGLCTWVALRRSWVLAAVLAGVFAGALMVWRARWPSSFRAAVSGRVWKRWRRWRVYRQPWAEICSLHGLTRSLDGATTAPKLLGVRVGYAVDEVTVEMPYGQSLTDWERRTDALCQAFGAIEVRPRDGKGRRVLVIEVVHEDTLAEPVPLELAERDRAVDLEAVPVGVTESGDPWRLRVLGDHTLVAGATGSGKGSVIWSVIAGLGPAISQGLAELWVVDPKGGMELALGSRLFARFAPGGAGEALVLLREAAALLAERATRLRGVTRSHVPTPAEPLVVVVVDEIGTLTAYCPDRRIRTEIEQLLALVLSQGRAVGVSVVAAVQDPSKEVLPLRQLFSVRVALRLTEASQVTMVLGEGAREQGAACDAIPVGLPGVGYVSIDGRSEIIKVRASHVTDANIGAMVRRFGPPPSSAGGER
jgi:S-DNA-T family DNA segregation ATPase FtsK/SpoIIIE